MSKHVVWQMILGVLLLLGSVNRDNIVLAEILGTNEDNQVERQEEVITPTEESEVLIKPTVNEKEYSFLMESVSVYQLYPQMQLPESQSIDYVKFSQEDYEQIFIKGKATKEQVTSLLYAGSPIDHYGYEQLYLSDLEKKKRKKVARLLTQGALMALVSSEYRQQIEASFQESNQESMDYYYAVFGTGNSGESYLAEAEIVGAPYVLEIHENQQESESGLFHVVCTFDGTVEFIDLPKTIKIVDENGKELKKPLRNGQYFKIIATKQQDELITLNYEYSYDEVEISFYAPKNAEDEKLYTPFICATATGRQLKKKYDRAFVVREEKSLGQSNRAGTTESEENEESLHVQDDLVQVPESNEQFTDEPIVEGKKNAVDQSDNHIENKRDIKPTQTEEAVVTAVQEDGNLIEPTEEEALLSSEEGDLEVERQEVREEVNRDEAVQKSRTGAAVVILVCISIGWLVKKKRKLR